MRIRAYSLNIKEVFKMGFCTKCGNQLADGAAFCTKCGTPQGAAAPQAQPQMQPQQPVYQQPVYQQPAQPINVGASLAANKGIIKIILAAANALLMLAMMVPYYGGGEKACRFFNDYATVDTYGMTAIVFAFMTIVSLYVLKNKILTTCFCGFNCFITLLSLCTAKISSYNKAGAGFIISIIALVFMVLALVGYFVSTDDK